MNRRRLEVLLRGFPSKRIGIIGDFCLDIYWHADMTRSLLSRETPRFPRPVFRESFSPGGAANVAWNLRELGVGAVVPIGVFGDDWRGRELARILEKSLGCDLCRVVHAPGRLTPAFAKPVLHGYQSEQHRGCGGGLPGGGGDGEEAGHHGRGEPGRGTRAGKRGAFLLSS